MDTQPLSGSSRNMVVSFPEIANQDPLATSLGRLYSRQTITQQTLVEGPNRAILLRDDKGVTRLLLGYQKGGF